VGLPRVGSAYQPVVIICLAIESIVQGHKSWPFPIVLFIFLVGPCCSIWFSCWAIGSSTGVNSRALLVAFIVFIVFLLPCWAIGWSAWAEMLSDSRSRRRARVTGQASGYNLSDLARHELLCCKSCTWPCCMMKNLKKSWTSKHEMHKCTQTLLAGVNVRARTHTHTPGWIRQGSDAGGKGC